MSDYSTNQSISFFEFVNPAYVVAAFAFLLCLCGASNIKAQGVGGYTFAASSGTFTPLSGATVFAVPQGGADDNFYPAAPIGFTFKYDGTNYTQVYAITNGFMSFVSTGGSYQRENSLDGSTTVQRPFVAPLFDDLDMSSGSVSYQTTGASPNRVFTMQYLNALWDYSAAGPTISFQVKLYETTNQVQFVYRQEASAVSNSSGGASIGLAGTATGSGNFLSLNNAGTAPTASSTVDTKTIATRPATGQIYTFAPRPTAAGTSVGGRVAEASGRGIFRVLVTMTDSLGNQRHAFTNQQGYFRFEDVPSGQVYVFTAQHRRYSFDQPTQVQFIGEETNGINFVGTTNGVFRADIWNLPTKKIE